MVSPYLERPTRKLFEAVIDGALDGDSARSTLFEFFDRLEIGVLITDVGIQPRGPRILHANLAYCRACRFDAERLIGATPHVLHGPETDREAARRFRATLEREGRATVDLVNYGGDGVPYRMHLVAGKLTLGPGDDTDLRIAFALRLD